MENARDESVRRQYVNGNKRFVLFFLLRIVRIVLETNRPSVKKSHAGDYNERLK